jgi:hypothetical protein
MYAFTREEAAARSEQRRALLRQVEELEKLPPEKEAQRRDLEAQMRAAYAAAPTRSRKDPPFTAEQQAQVDRAQVEGRRLEEAMRRVESEHRASVKPQTDPLRARADEFQQGPQLFAVSIGMNVARLPESIPAARGAVLSFGPASPRQSATLQPVNVVVTVEGPAGPARDALVGLVDRAYLEGLLGRPLPEVAGSKQRIDGNIARAAAAAPLAIAGSAPGTVPASSAVSPAGAPAAAASNPGGAAAAALAPPAPRGTGAAPCPPAQSAQAPADGARGGRDVGAEVGGAVLGGGWGRGIGASVGGVLGALGGSAKKDEPTPASAAADCPR